MLLHRDRAPAYRTRGDEAVAHGYAELVWI
jgi:hypothetical protein